MLDRMPYTDVEDPDYIELLTYSELSALFELHGHLRAANPANQVQADRWQAGPDRLRFACHIARWYRLEHGHK